MINQASLGARPFVCIYTCACNGILATSPSKVMAATPVLKACVCGELNDRLLVHMLEVGLQGFQLHTSFIDPGCRVYKHLCQGQCHRAKEAWDVVELFVELCNLDWLVPNVPLRCRCSNLWIISWDSQDLIKYHHSVLDYQTCDIDTVTPIALVPLPALRLRRRFVMYCWNLWLTPTNPSPIFELDIWLWNRISEHAFKDMLQGITG